MPGSTPGFPKGSLQTFKEDVPKEYGMADGLIIVITAVVCVSAGFLAGCASLRIKTKKDIKSLHAELSGIKKAEEVGVMFPEEYNVRVNEIMKNFIKQNIPEKLAEAIYDYVDARIYLERMD